MISIFQATLLGLLQGLTELFPISSLGHSVILPSLLNWKIDQKDPIFLIFLVATHFATALVLFFFFFGDWQKILSGLLRSLKLREVQNSDYYAKLGWLLVVGTVPAGILGLLFEERLKTLFAFAQITSVFLLLNGVLLFVGEVLRRKKSETVSLAASDQRISNLSWGQIVFVGLMQAVALIPGFSRTGATMVGSLLAGLNHEDSARLSFLLATPIIGAAALLKLPELLVGANIISFNQVIVGMVASALAAYLSVKFLTKYFRTNRLTPFAVYCLLVGISSFLILLSR